MNDEYNPQLGYRRTLFGEEYDFLTHLCSCRVQEKALILEAETYRGRKAAVRVEFLTETVFRFRMFPSGKQESCGNPVIAPGTPAQAKMGDPVIPTEGSSQAQMGNPMISPDESGMAKTDNPFTAMLSGEAPSYRENENPYGSTCETAPETQDLCVAQRGILKSAQCLSLSCPEIQDLRIAQRGAVNEGNSILKESEHWYEYGNDQIRVRFRKEYWEMSVSLMGKELTKEQIFDTNVDNRWKMLPLGFCCDETGRCTSVYENMYLYSDEAFWGFGEKFTDFNKRGQVLQCWQKDALSTNTEDSYKSHPFFMSSRGYAVLLNTFSRCTFDMGRSSQVSYQMRAEDDSLDYIFFAEPSGDYKKLLQQYIALTGPIPMIPKWAFGFWMSRCSYQNRGQIEEVVNRAQKEDLPLDVIHIDGWQRKDALGTWEWDTERFPDPEGMIRWLQERKIYLSIWNYPYVTEDSSMFHELEARGYFVKNKKGETALFYAMADAPCRAACYDFTNPEFLDWYQDRIEVILKMGVSVIKTDFSEAVPEDVRFYDGSSGIEGHNKLTYLYAKTVYDAMKKHGMQEGREPLLWGRSGYAGSHRIPAAWAGDSSSALNNHSAVLRGGLSIALSGVSFWGFDLGGFYNTDASGDECPPTEEEYIRSVELGMLMPLARAHGKTPREPWNISARAMDIVRRYDIARHRMAPYLYSAACESSIEGIPMLRPLLLEFPGDPTARMQELSYMLGGSLLVAPPFDRKEYEVYLPEGRWLNLSDGTVLDGKQYIHVSPALEELPVFQRADSILPLLDEKSCGHVPEGTFQDMEVTLFFESDMECRFYDRDSEGQVHAYYFRAYTKELDDHLYIETDMNITKINLKAKEDFCASRSVLLQTK